MQTLVSNISSYDTQSFLAFDSQNNPHLDYYNSAGTLIYTSWTGSGWDNQTIDANRIAPGPMAFDSYSNPYLAFNHYMGSFGSFTVGYATVTEPKSIIQATQSDGSTVNLLIKGNITNSQFSNVSVKANISTKTTILSFTLTGKSDTTGFSNITIPKSAIPYGTKPTIYINNQTAQDQNYTQEANNYYVWLTTNTSSNDVSIVFKIVPSNAPIEILPIIAISLIIVVVAIVLGLLHRRHRKPTLSSNSL